MPTIYGPRTPHLLPSISPCVAEASTLAAASETTLRSRARYSQYSEPRYQTPIALTIASCGPDTTLRSSLPLTTSEPSRRKPVSRHHPLSTFGNMAYCIYAYERMIPWPKSRTALERERYMYAIVDLSISRNVSGSSYRSAIRIPARVLSDSSSRLRG